MTQKLYKTDLTNEEWKIIEPFIPQPKQGGRPREVNIRLVVDGIFYRLRTGCSWEMLPKEYGKCKTIYGYFNEWSKDGNWKAINDELVAKVRLKEGRGEQPTLAIIDSQSMKTTQKKPV
jgi:putative transposase